MIYLDTNILIYVFCKNVDNFDTYHIVSSITNIINA